MTPSAVVDDVLARRLHTRAGASRWHVSVATFATALTASAARGLPAGSDRDALVAYLDALHLEDLALACACADGDDVAWAHVMATYRPPLHRAAGALDPTGGARELADEIFGDLYGTRERDGARVSLFRYFHGRSSLATWLRSVLAQRHVDRRRVTRRLDPLSDDDSPAARPAPIAERAGAAAMSAAEAGALRQALTRAIARLTPRDRLQLGCYHAQGMTLKAIARLTGEHEATVSRHLARSREAVRTDVLALLASDHGFSQARAAECIAAATADAGALDLADLFGEPPDRKTPEALRSKEETP